MESLALGWVGHGPGRMWLLMESTPAVLTAANCDHPQVLGISSGELRSCKTERGSRLTWGQQYSMQDKNGLKWPCSKKAFQRRGLVCLADSSHLLTTMDLFLEGNCAVFLYVNPWRGTKDLMFF